MFVVIRRSLSYWRRALLVFVIGALVSVPIVFTRPRLYRSETVILYQETIRSADLTGGEGGGEGSARRVGARLREVLLSRASLEPIIQDLGLYIKNPDPRELVDAVEEMRKHIVFKAREGDTFLIAFDGSTPEEAKEVTRRLGDCIIQEAASRRTETAKTLKEFLSAESERNSVELRNKEAELAKFIALYPAFAARLRNQPATPAAGPPGQDTAARTADPVLASLEVRAARIERQLAKVGKAPSSTPSFKPTPFQPPPDSPELVAARRDLAEKSARYTEKHPDVIAARARLRAAEDAQAMANAAAADAHAASQVAAARAAADEPAPKNAADEAALRQQLADLHAQMAHRRASLRGDAVDASSVAVPGEQHGSAVALEVEFQRLEREVTEVRDRQRQLDERLFKASITANSVMNDRNIQVSVLDPAYLPSTPVSKPRSLMLGASLVLSLILATLTAFLSAKLDDKIYDRVDLEKLDILPVVGVIPRSLPPKR